MATEITMPRLSDTMEQGTIARWLKQEGDSVTRGEVIAEIETDKANMELESYAAGIMARILVSEGQSAALGAPIALVAADAEEAERLKEAPAGKAQAAPQQETPGGEPQEAAGGSTDSPDGSVQPGQPPPAPPRELPSGGAVEEGAVHGRIKASPLARRMAQEHEIDLAAVTGTGPGGRITKEDVQAFLRQSGAEARPTVAAQGEQAPAPAAQPAAAAPAVLDGGRAPQPVEMTRMQRTIARRMTESRFSKPEFVLTAEIDMTEARALLRSVASVEGAPRVGPNDLLIKTIALALVQHPEVNAGWENDTIVRYGRINIGFAVAIEGGLVVPVIQDADRKSLGQIATEAKELIEKARSGKLAPAYYAHGTFTVSNLGMYGIDQFTPILNAPEACILGVGTIAPKPVVVDGQVVVRDRMRVDLACDHRVINGAQGADYLQTVRRLLEHPMLAVL